MSTGSLSPADYPADTVTIVGVLPFVFVAEPFVEPAAFLKPVHATGKGFVYDLQDELD